MEQLIIQDSTKNIPKGWEIKKLAEVCEELFAGGDVPKDNSSKIETREYRIPIFSNGEKNKGLYGYTNFARVTKPSITISARGTIGYSEIREEAFYPAIRLIVVIPKTNILDLSFLKYVIGSIDFTHSGSSIPQLTVPMIKEYLIPIPPFSEQQRIVTILDKAFAAIATAKANAEQNLKNAKELFESYLQGVFERKSELGFVGLKDDKINADTEILKSTNPKNHNSDIGKDWEEKMLSDVLQKTETVDPTKKPDEKFIYLDVSSVNKETKEIESPTILMGKDAPSRARKLVRTNDVIFATVRPTHSRVALITEEYNEQVCSTGYFVLRAKEFLNNKLVFYFLLTYGFNKQMEKLQKGASYPAVTDSEVKGIIIPYPKSKSEQQAIIQKLDALSAETKKLEAIYQKKLVDLEELKKSVLQKAFNGKL